MLVLRLDQGRCQAQGGGEGETRQGHTRCVFVFEVGTGHGKKPTRL